MFRLHGSCRLHPRVKWSWDDTDRCDGHRRTCYNTDQRDQRLTNCADTREYDGDRNAQLGVKGSDHGVAIDTLDNCARKFNTTTHKYKSPITGGERDQTFRSYS